MHRLSFSFSTLLAAVLGSGCSGDTPESAAMPALPAGNPVEAAPFADAAAGSGLVFEHFIGASGEYFMCEVMGAGVALFDYDLDGDLDVYLIQGQMLGSGRTPADSSFPPSNHHQPGNRLFRNDLIPAGQLTFSDVTALRSRPRSVWHGCGGRRYR